MNIATGKLSAPTVKQASILDAITEAGTVLAKFRGAGGEAIPYALSAGIGAGAQQATNRLLRRRLINSPNILKALELGSATALGGGAGLAGALAAPLSRGITHTGAGSAARQIGELSAMGAGAELALGPAISGLLGAPVGVSETLGKMFGGGALALGGQIAKDQRNLSVLRDHYIAGGKLPKIVDPNVLNLSLRDNISKRYKGLGIPEGGLLGASGLGLMAAGNPYLGAAAMLAAPLKNETTSKYIGDVVRELRAGATKAKVDQKTKDTIDGLYKNSSYSIKLAAPVYTTHYCLDAPTFEKVALIPQIRNAAKWVGSTANKAYGAGKTYAASAASQLGSTANKAYGAGRTYVANAASQLGATAAGQAATRAYGAGRNYLGEGAGRLYEGVRGSRMFSGTTRQAHRGRNQMMGMVNTQAPNMQNPAQVAESALLHEMGTGAAQGNTLNPLQAPVHSTPASGWGEAFSRGRKARGVERQQQYANTEQGYQAYVDLGAKPTASNSAQQAAGRFNSNASNVQAQAQASLAPTATAPVRAPTTFAGSGNANTQLSESAISRLEALSDETAANTLLNTLNKKPAGSLTADEQQILSILRGARVGKSGITSSSFSTLKSSVSNSRTSLTTFDTAQAAVSKQRRAIASSPLTAPVQAGERATATPNLPASGPSQALEAASTAQRDIPVVGGRVQGVFQYRPGGNPRGTFTSADQGLEIANIRFADSQLGKDLIAIEGRGGLGEGSTLFQQGDILQAQTQAAKRAQLHTRAAASTQATNALTAEIQQSLTNNPAAYADLEASLTELAKKSGEVTPDRVIQAVNARLRARGPGVAALATAEEAAIRSAFSGESGKAFSTAQKELDGAMELYNSNLKKGLEQQLNKAEATLSDNLATRVDKMSKETTRPLGFGQARRNAAEIQDLEEVRALVETRSRIMRESGTIADRTQAAEMMRITEEALRSGSAEEIRALKQALANPGEAISSSGAASGLHRILDTPARRQAFNLTNEQLNKFRDVVKMEGRGAGDQVKATREIFSTQAARSPNSAQGRELSQVVTEAAGGDKVKAQAFLDLGRQGGAGGSAFGKLTSGNKSAYSAEGYTMAELQAMGATPATPTSLSPGAAQVFERYIMRGRGTISENVATIDAQIDQAQRSLRSARPPAQAQINNELRALQQARAEAQNFIATQNRALWNTFSIAQAAEQAAANLVKKDIRMGNITLLNDAAKVQVPRNMNLDATRSALEATASSDPAQHSKMVEGVFAQLKRSNPSMADEAIAQRMVTDGLVTAEQLVAMGGPQAFVQGTATQAGGGAMAGIAALGAAGLGTAALAGRKPGAATQAKQQVEQQVRAAWGLSPLHAPVIRSKVASPIKPISLKDTQPKLPNPMKIPAQSLLTATVEGQDQAMKMSSLLAAPVRGLRHGSV